MHLKSALVIAAVFVSMGCAAAGKAEVLVDGKPLPKVDDLDSKDECWSRGPVSTILVKVKSGDQPRQIEVRMLQR